MQFKAIARGLPCSPYKMRPLVDVIRGKRVDYALAWCKANKTRRMVPLIKLLDSVIANARQGGDVATNSLLVKKICVDQGTTTRYFKPGAQGRAMVRRRRLCHVSVIIETTKNEASSGSKG